MEEKGKLYPYACARLNSRNGSKNTPLFSTGELFENDIFSNFRPSLLVVLVCVYRISLCLGYESEKL